MDKKLLEFMYEKFLSQGSEWQDDFNGMVIKILNDYKKSLILEKEGLKKSLYPRQEQLKLLPKTAEVDDIRCELDAAIISNKDILADIEKTTNRLRQLLDQSQEILLHPISNEVQTIAHFFVNNIPDIIKLKKETRVGVLKTVSDLERPKTKEYYEQAVKEKKKKLDENRSKLEEEAEKISNRIKLLTEKIESICEAIYKINSNLTN